MSSIDVSELLRPGLLQGVSIMLATATAAATATGGEVGDDDRSLGTAVAGACRQLGASVWECPLGSERSPVPDELALDDAVERLLLDAGRLDLLVVDAAGLFASAYAVVTTATTTTTTTTGGGPEGARKALAACLDTSWNVTRAVVTRAFLPGAPGAPGAPAVPGAPGRPGGRVVYLAPARDAGDHADAARAGLENLARTLSIEWARHGITTVAVAPGAASRADREGAAGERTAAARAAVASEVGALSAYLASAAGAYFSGCLLDLGGELARGG